MKKILPLVLAPVISYGASSAEECPSTPQRQITKRDRSEFHSDIVDPADPRACRAPSRPIIHRRTIHVDIPPVEGLDRPATQLEMLAHISSNVRPLHIHSAVLESRGPRSVDAFDLRTYTPKK